MSANNNINLCNHSLAVMHTQLDMVFWGAKPDLYQSAIQDITNNTNQLELILSRYHPKSELYLLNQDAYSKWIQVSDALWDAISMGWKYNTLTHGYFDISLGTLFHHHKENNAITCHPSGSFSDRIVLDKPNKSIRFQQQDVSIDFGGMGKGMALSMIDSLLNKYRIHNAFISFGGSSILTRGSHPHGDYWPFSLAEQEKNHKIWQLNNDSLSISCSHRKINNGIATHIINPNKHNIIKNKKTAIVQSENPVDAEILSTTLLASPIEEHQDIVKNFNDISYCII
jgi:thiamine biosynthesis lipoprotein ApbE